MLYFLSTLQQRNSLLKPYHVTTHAIYCRLSPLVASLMQYPWAVWSAGSLNSGELRSNECWLGNRSPLPDCFELLVRVISFIGLFEIPPGLGGFLKHQKKSIAAPWLRCTRQITASHLSVRAETSAEVCVLKPAGSRGVRVKIFFKRRAGEAALM